MQQEGNENASSGTPPPEYYHWSVEGKPVTVRLAYDVVDRLQAEVMQGFGAIPKRGAEVGGLLLGTAVKGEMLDVVIDDFAPVACEHRLGPSFALSDADHERFAAAVAEWRRKDRSERYVVGYYRSNTRAEFSLSDEDLALCEKYLPDSSNVFLLIKPFATRACQAGFFFWEDGSIRVETPYGVFPFRRQDIGGGPSPKHAAAPPAPPRAPSAPTQDEPEETGRARRERLFPVASRESSPAEPVSIRSLGRFSVASPGPSEIEERPAQPPAAAPIISPLESLAPPRNKRRIPLPLAFVFLLLGILLGFQAALQMRPAPQPATIEETVRLGLTVAQRGNNIQLNWNRSSTLVAAAQRAVLYIWDGATQQSTDLDAATLRGGNVVYRRITGTVRFRLELYLANGVSVSETTEWRMP